MITFWNLQILLKRFFKYKGQNRSSHQRCSMKKGALRNFANFTGKHLCQSLWLRWFPVDFEKFFRTPFSQNTSGRLLLKRFKEFSIQNIFFVLKNGSFIHVSLGHVRSVNDSSTTMNALRKIQKHSPADVLLKGCCGSSVRNTYDGVHF